MHDQKWDIRNNVNVGRQGGPTVRWDREPEGIEMCTKNLDLQYKSNFHMLSQHSAVFWPKLVKIVFKL